MAGLDRLLELIEDGVNAHGGDLGGWTQRTDDSLQLFDGRVTLSAYDAGQNDRAGYLHAHVLATLHDYDDQVLDGCVVGFGDDDEQALKQAAGIWIACIAGPIRSFLDNKPVCMTCQAGVADGDQSQGYSAGDYGLAGVRAFVGPSIARGFTEGEPPAQDDTQPWFRFAAESAAPRTVHLAKATISHIAGEGWSRKLEVDGHDVTLEEKSWPAHVPAASNGYMTRFAVFEFPRNSTHIARRADLERTIRHFAARYSAASSVDQLKQELVEGGFDADLVHQVESISTIAFGRFMFEPYGIAYSPTIIRARRDGRIEREVPLISLPAYNRALALAPRLRDELSEEAFRALCFYNAESNAILQALEQLGPNPDLSGFRLYPSVVPDRDVSDETMQAALAVLNTLVEERRTTKNKPWWKFWTLF